MRTERRPTREKLELLPWDSHHFGFAVARIVDSALNDRDLRSRLEHARRSQVRLVYWAADPGCSVPAEILGEFHGLLVDRKATYERSLPDPSPLSNAPPGCRVVEHRGPECNGDMLDLAVAAGAHSRFRLDPGISRQAFERLYQHWLLRSIDGELADLVLVAVDETGPGQPAGLITLALSEGQVSIGLLAVGQDMRGRGIGTELIRAAHRWCDSRRTERALVVTQLDNGAACRLYEKCGYRRTRLKHVYHFWPR